MMRWGLGLTALLAAALPVPAAAQDVSWVTLLPGWAEADGRRVVGVEITLAPGWKTYWRSPMGGGIPPRFDWSGSSNVATTAMHWPEPEVFDEQGVRSIGYKDAVVFPIAVTPADPSAPVDLRLSLSYGVCEVVCIPAEATLTATLDGDAAGGEGAIRGALADRPQTAAEAGYGGVVCRVAPDGGRSYALTAEIPAEGPVANPGLPVFETGDEALFVMPEAVRETPDGIAIDAEMAYYGEGAFAFDRSALRLTLFGADGAVEFEGCTAPTG